MRPQQIDRRKIDWFLAHKKEDMKWEIYSYPFKKLNRTERLLALFLRQRSWEKDEDRKIYLQTGKYPEHDKIMQVRWDDYVAFRYHIIKYLQHENLQYGWVQVTSIFSDFTTEQKQNEWLVIWNEAIIHLVTSNELELKDGQPLTSHMITEEEYLDQRHKNNCKNANEQEL